jgi:hypothetical protein
MRHLTVAGTGDRFLDGGHAVGDQFGLAHQTGAEPARLHPVGRAADVQIDLVIAEGLADPRRLGQLGRVGPAQLQGDRMFDGVEAQQPLRSPCSTAGAVTISV